MVYGVQRTPMTRVLAGRGRAVAVMFRPAGFRGLLGRPMHTITERAVPAGDVLGPRAARLGAAMPVLTTPQAVAALTDLLERLVRDFTRVFGVPPARYARLTTPGTA
nr:MULTISPECIES: DUF6597 domain-containing transcriptional factor [Protofrankia]